MELCKISDCTGCLACMNVCPKDAIAVVEDKLGKTIPYIDKGKCISCGLCRRVCPELNKQQFNRADCSYAVWSKSEKDIRLSSSGGAASVFAKIVIKNSGVVYGCASCDGTAKHMSVETIDDIDKLRGSKYVWSDIGMIYRDVQLKLNEGRMVLFTGTPCQIAGLKGYLCKDFENLITMDIICHGAPPIAYLKTHINNKIGNSSFDSFSFRGEYDFFLTVRHKDKIIYKKKREMDEYFVAFSDALTYRDNCYSCRYAKPDRVSDITVGDFWGIDRDSLKTSYKGRISVVLPNTIKGRAFFDECKDGLIYEKRTFDEAANSTQGNLLHPSIPHSKRDVFMRSYIKYGFDDAIKKVGIKNIVRRNRNKYIVGQVKMAISKIIKF